MKPRLTDSAARFALEPTLQVKVDANGTPLELPPVRRPTPAPAAPLEPAPEPPARVVRSNKTPIPSRVTPAAAFNAVEADFFAREADLYKREAVETFDDLDPGTGHDSRPSKNRRRK